MRILILGASLALLLTLPAHAQTPGTNAPAPAATPGSHAAEASTPSAFVVKFRVRPGKNAAFEQAFREMQKGVREKEPGNLYYDLYVTDQDPQTYVILEHYRDAAAVAAHGKSEHAKKLLADLRDLLEGPPEAQRLVLVSSKQ